jgi:hypothetical protein
VAGVLRHAFDEVLLSLGACSGSAAGICASLAHTLGFGAGHAAIACAAAATCSASAAALCDDRTCCSELLGSVIQAVVIIECIERDPDGSAVLWVVPASVKVSE